MSMTKREFIALADLVKGAERRLRSHNEDRLPTEVVIEEYRDALAAFCRDQNPRFDRNLWFDYIAGACGPSGGKVKQVKQTKQISLVDSNSAKRVR